MPDATITSDPLQAGREALERHEWNEAFELLKRADAQGGLSPDGLADLGLAAWWAGHMEDCIEARQRAYAAYLAEGDVDGAALTAVRLARDYGAKLEQLQAAGWLQRAARLLEGRPDSVARGWLHQVQGHIAETQGRLEEALEHGRRTVEIGMRLGDKDLQALGLNRQGLALVGMGKVDDGLALLDEGMVPAVAGELSPMVTGIVYCNTITACAELADYRRAGEWTEAAKRWCERQSISGFPGVCRVHRAEIMRLRGAWGEAEADARQASAEMEAHGLPAFAGDAFYELGEIRLHMGDLSAAEEAFRQAHELGRDPQPGLALVRLGQGKPDAAAAMLRRAVADARRPLAKAKLLPAQARVAIAVRDGPTASAATEELERIAATFRSPAISASAAMARGEVQLHEGDPAAAIGSLRSAWQRWREAEAPYEAAQARLLLGQAYRAEGDEESAQLELHAARSAFERLGAVRDAARATELLEAPGGDGAQAERGLRARRTFVFTDIVQSTNLVEVLGDDAWEDLVRWHASTLRSVIEEHRGEVVSDTGDGFFAAFPDAVPALRCAVAIQRRLADHRRTHGFAPQVRIGVHSADATRVDENYRGRGVHEAARIGALAEGGEVLASASTVDDCGTAFSFGERRSVTLKGISEPVEVVPIDWRNSGDTA